MRDLLKILNSQEEEFKLYGLINFNRHKSADWRKGKFISYILKDFISNDKGRELKFIAKVGISLSHLPL